MGSKATRAADKMKILVLSFYYYPDLCAGSFRADAFISALMKKIPIDAEVHLVTTMPNRYKSFKQEALAYEKNGNLIIRRIELPSHESGMIDQVKAFLVFAFKAFILTRKNKYQLVFATSSRLMTASLGALIAKNGKSPLYLDIRDIFVDTISDIFSKKKAFLFIPIFSIIEKFTFTQAKKINLVSEGFKEYFIDRFPDKFFSFYTNGIDKEFLGVDYSQPNVSSIKTVLYAGNIGEGQGLHLIIPNLAIKFKGKMHFRIIGDGGRKNALLKALEAHPEIDNVDLISPVNREILIGEYKKADILFMHLNNYPAFEKVLPSKLFEYAATGKPVWAGLSGFPAEFCKREMINAAVFSPCNADEAIQSLSKIEMTSVDRADFINRFSRENIMSNMAQDVLGML